MVVEPHLVEPASAPDPVCLDRVDDGGHDDGEEHIGVEECSFAEGGAGDGIGCLAEYVPDYPALVVVIFEVQLDQVEASRAEEARLVAVGKFNFQRCRVCVGEVDAEFLEYCQTIVNSILKFCLSNIGQNLSCPSSNSIVCTLSIREDWIQRLKCTIIAVCEERKRWC